jgi:7-keto-8-aminopelargonate synthetase-like enzyme
MSLTLRLLISGSKVRVSRDPGSAGDPNFINGVVDALWRENRIYVRSVPIPTRVPPTRSAIRVSTNIFNSIEEIEKLIEAVQLIAP